MKYVAAVDIESLPQRGGHKSEQRRAHEKSRAFKRAQRFRAGVEGRISTSPDPKKSPTPIGRKDLTQRRRDAKAQRRKGAKGRAATG